MLLAHLIPFLDTEIDRLQRARDLLAYVPPSEWTSPRPAQAVAVSPLLASAPQISQPAAAEPAPLVAQLPAPQVVVLKPFKRGSERAPRRRKQRPSVDTALRGSVPTGPVVVSAQAVRQAQETKSAQASKPTAEPLAPLDWRSRSSDTENAILLRKLLNIGTSEEAPHAGASDQLARFMHS